MLARFVVLSFATVFHQYFYGVSPVAQMDPFQRAPNDRLQDLMSKWSEKHTWPDDTPPWSVVLHDSSTPHTGHFGLLLITLNMIPVAEVEIRL